MKIMASSWEARKYRDNIKPQMAEMEKNNDSVNLGKTEKKPDFLLTKELVSQKASDAPDDINGGTVMLSMLGFMGGLAGAAAAINAGGTAGAIIMGLGGAVTGAAVGASVALKNEASHKGVIASAIAGGVGFGLVYGAIGATGGFVRTPVGGSFNLAAAIIAGGGPGVFAGMYLSEKLQGQ